MKVSNAKDLGSAVRSARRRAGLTQRELAEACGCGTRFVSNLENGKPTIEFDKAVLVLNVLSLDLDVSGRSFH